MKIIQAKIIIPLIYITFVLIAMKTLPAATSPAHIKPVQSTTTRIKPLALEYRLLAQLSKTAGFSRQTIIKEAKYLTSYGGSGYSLTSLPANNYAASKQRKVRLAAYLSLTEPHLRAAAGCVKTFTRHHRISINSGRASEYAKSRAYRIYRYIAGTNNIINRDKNIISSLQSRRAVTPEESRRVQDQIQNINMQINILKGLEKDLKKIIPRVLAYDKLADDIRASGKNDILLQKVKVLKKRAADMAAGDANIIKSEAVGTQQVRITLTAGKRDEIRSILEGRIGNELKQDKKKTGFIKGKLDFLPLPFPVSKKVQLAGDYHVTEYVCEKELFLTLFDCYGLWHRLIALEYKGKIYLMLPSP